MLPVKDDKNMQVWAVVRSQSGELDGDAVNSQLKKIRGFAFENGDTIESYIDVFKFTTIEVLKRLTDRGIERVYIESPRQISPNFDGQIAFLASCGALGIEVISVIGGKFHLELNFEELVRAKLFDFQNDGRQGNQNRARIQPRVFKRKGSLK